MLVLTRKEGEVLNIYTTDGVIKVHVKSVRSGQARIGVDAPCSVQIMRDEIDDGLVAFSVAKNEIIPHLQESYTHFASRIIHRCINFFLSAQRKLR